MSRSATGEIRWGIIGTANIARRQFLPGLAEAGGGRAIAVGGRDGRRAAEWAAAEGVERGVEGYDAVVEAGDVDAVYVALPNALHAEWAGRALRAGKAVLCEKLLCRTAAEAEPLLRAASAPDALLWESFVFPFHAQHARLLELVASGVLGDLREIVSAFHFRVRPPEPGQPPNIRLVPELGGGALADVGCYPVRLAQELLGAPPLVTGAADRGAGGDGGGGDGGGGDGGDTAGHAGRAGRAGRRLSCLARTGEHGAAIDVDTCAIVEWGDARLVLSVGFERAYDTTTRVLGTAGRIELTDPFHPGPADTLRLVVDGEEEVVEHPTVDERSFAAAIRHVHAVLTGREAPRHLAVTDTLPTLQVLDRLDAAWRAAGGAGEPPAAR